MSTATITTARAPRFSLAARYGASVPQVAAMAVVAVFLLAFLVVPIVRVFMVAFTHPEGGFSLVHFGDFLRTRPEFATYAWDNDGKQRVPTVRNVDARPGKGWPKAFMHNGALKSLEEVVHFYNTRDVASEGWAPPEVDRNVNRELFEGKPLGNFELDAEAEAAIVAFLRTLTDRDVAKKPAGNAKK